MGLIGCATLIPTVRVLETKEEKCFDGHVIKKAVYTGKNENADQRYGFFVDVRIDQMASAGNVRSSSARSSNTQRKAQHGNA